ncbi:MAG: hypothetical protein CBD76_02890 [Pelagibacteraceae bacterium TMED216]|nr:MAG: hypothetical protein CBD76_02890 [Pelagibacteraceae bacterium TMED216]|tara:strand:- start:2255 stop:2638 length:384 start_codon:yes stop_codon:yes gene_type:complete
MKIILAEISAGELIDKITILEIKKENIADKEKQSNIEKELSALKTAMEQNIEMTEDLIKLKDELKTVNSTLWNIENEKRKCENQKKFDSNFIDLSRQVYKSNDKRAKIKFKINDMLGSNIKEVKSHF